MCFSQEIIKWNKYEPGAVLSLLQCSALDGLALTTAAMTDSEKHCPHDNITNLYQDRLVRACLQVVGPVVLRVRSREPACACIMQHHRHCCADVSCGLLVACSGDLSDFGGYHYTIRQGQRMSVRCPERFLLHTINPRRDETVQDAIERSMHHTQNGVDYT